MALTASPTAVVVRAPVTLSEVRQALPAVAGSPFRGHGLRRGLGRVAWGLGAFGEVLIVAYAFPLVILAIGIPIALFVRLAVDAGQALWRL